MAHSFTLQLSLKKVKEGTIHFKSDGNRFTADKTIKLNVGCEYVIELETRPNKAMQFIMLRDKNIPLVKNEIIDSDRVTYTAQWKTDDAEVTKKGKRAEISLVIKFQTGISLTLKLQVKFYADNEKSHSCWGNQLHYIEYECKVPAGSTTVQVIKDTYR